VLALALTGLVCSLLMGGSETMVEKERALPGRPSEMPVSDKHFVLGTPMKGPWPAGFKVAVFGNGCFWGSEKGIWRLPGGGIHSTAIGYAAGYTPNPTYEEVCSGRTGHTEAVQVVYDPSKISFVDILRWFWEAHDPTAGMGQGNDRGTQYRSGFYWTDDEQRQLIEASAAAYEAALSKKAGKPRNITTEMKAASEFDTIFYYGEDYHRARLAPPPDVARYGCSCDPSLSCPCRSSRHAQSNTSPSREHGRTARRSLKWSRFHLSSSGRLPRSRTHTPPNCQMPSGRNMGQRPTA
jgi:peptide-methionine (S)-S-oxide reductase